MPFLEEIEIGRIFLDSENPRHVPQETQPQVIEHLCKHEAVLQLAWDIAKHGTNPMERFAVYPAANGNSDDDSPPDAYVVVEGNRRLCALKILDDPDLAPAAYRKQFAAIRTVRPAIATVPCIVFPDKDDHELRLWRERIHGGEQGGVGRRPWNAEQKTRHTGADKNKVAQAVLDYAEKRGLISQEERKGKLTTVQRFLDNPIVREVIGIDVSDPSELRITRPVEDYETILEKFIKDVKKGQDGPVNSRTRTADRLSYARELGAVQLPSGARVEPEPMNPDGDIAQKPTRTKRQAPRRIRHVRYEAEIAKKLEALNATKLERLYHSICNVSLADHTPLVAVGAWAFIECLSAQAGRKDDTAFTSFYNKALFQIWGLGDGKQTKALVEALNRISKAGNLTKHHQIAGAFDGEQLANDLETLKDLIIKSAEEALAKGT